MDWRISWIERHSACVEAKTLEEAKEIAMGLTEEETMEEIEITEAKESNQYEK